MRFENLLTSIDPSKGRRDRKINDATCYKLKKKAQRREQSSGKQLLIIAFPKFIRTTGQVPAILK